MNNHLSGLLYSDRLLPEHLVTAMYYVTLKMVRNEEAYIVRSLFKSFKDNFKQATIINLIMIAVGAVLYLDLNVDQKYAWKCRSVFFM